MKIIKKIILFTLVSMVIIGCAQYEPTLKEEFEKVYERLEFELNKELLEEFEYGLVNSQDRKSVV